MPKWKRGSGNIRVREKNDVTRRGFGFKGSEYWRRAIRRKAERTVVYLSNGITKKGHQTMMVFVIGLNGVRLMPTTPRKARKLLEKGKATVYMKRPFTIQLKYKTGTTTQKVDLGVDTGSQHIGIGIVSEGKVLYKANITLRDTMEKRGLIETKATYRRGRRYRKVRYRKPKFKFHTKRTYSDKLVVRKSTKHKTHWIKETNSIQTGAHAGWLPPSVQSKLDHHINWIDRYLDILPQGTVLRIELGRFDVARMKDPTIHNELYQQGPMYDHENVKAYVFSRDNYTCKCCKAKAGSVRKDGTSVKLVAHHLLMRSKGATDNPDYLASVCDHCHDGISHKEGVLYEWYCKLKPFKRGYRDATLMNILQIRLRAYYTNAFFTYGNITTADRKTLMLSKSHANDAVAIAAHGQSSVKNTLETLFFVQVRKKKRSLHEATPRKGRKEPNRTAKRNEKNTKRIGEFFLYDKVRYKDEIGWISGFSGGCMAYVKDRTGAYIGDEDKSYKKVLLSKLRILKRNNNWIQYCGNSSPI